MKFILDGVCEHNEELFEHFESTEVARNQLACSLADDLNVDDQGYSADYK